MGRPSPFPRAVAALTAILAVAASGAPALSQGGPGGGPPAPGGLMGGEAPRSGPGPRGAPGFGGSISGRVTIIGPQEPTELPRPSFATPAPVFSPERIDRLDPAIIDRMRLQNLTPGLGVRPPATPQPKPSAPVEAALPSPTAPMLAPSVKQTLSLSAMFAEKGAAIRSGVKWRLFTDQADANGEHMLVAESNDPHPRFHVDPGAYIVHAVYGLVSAAKFVTVPASQGSAQTMVLPAGAVRLWAFVGGEKAPPGAVTFTLTRDDSGVARTIAEHVKPGELLRLPAGAYHVSSAYGDANASVEADLQVGAGKLVEAQVHHKAAHVALKLVPSPGGRELSDTSWTVLTPGGDVIRDSIGALSGLVLAEGDYTAIARRDGRLYQQSFVVKAGSDATVEVVAR